MNYIFVYSGFLFYMFASTFRAQAHPGVYVKAGTNVFISAGTVFSTGSLALMPSAGFNISGVIAQL